jgi:nicotinamidase-related amidase
MARPSRRNSFHRSNHNRLEQHELEYYSDFAQQFRSGPRASRVSAFIGGLATDYCVLSTVKDALALGQDVLRCDPRRERATRQPKR